MQFHRDNSERINIVSAIGDEGIRIGDQLILPPCVISVSNIIEQWDGRDITTLSAQHFTDIIAWQPELILLGSGHKLCFPPHDLTQFINDKQIGFEVMDTAAGCRTYNVLAHEGRNVALALVAI